MIIKRSKQDGFVILENLVAILIFSIGILGLVGLLAASVRSVADAKYRGDAALLANRIIGQMWISDKTNTALKSNFQSPSGTLFTPWKAVVEGALPAAASDLPTIVVDNDNVATITILWRAPGEATPHRYVVSARIND